MTPHTASGGSATLPHAENNTTRSANLFFGILAIVLAALVAAMMTWGLVALALTAVAMVPVVFVFLVLITLG